MRPMTSLMVKLPTSATASALNSCPEYSRSFGPTESSRILCRWEPRWREAAESSLPPLPVFFLGLGLAVAVALLLLLLLLLL